MDPAAAPGADPGAPLADEMRRPLERLLGRALADLRVHDHAQAARLSRSVGAAAFTLGRHVYLARPLPSLPPAQALSLLAHEATHVAQQVPAAGTRPVVQRAAAGAAAPAPLPAAEQEAGQVEASAQQAAPPAPRPIDPAAVAERVYRRILRDLQLERERGA